VNFLVPFVFTLSPEELGVLLQAPIGDVLRTSITAALGVAALAAGLAIFGATAAAHLVRTRDWQ
jgi:hypothetical protein